MDTNVFMMLIYNEGEPGELNIPGFGEKFIGVRAGGTLELHGKDKPSWTKLTSTVTKTDTSQLYSFNHRVNRTNNVRSGGVIREG